MENTNIPPGQPRPPHLGTIGGARPLSYPTALTGDDIEQLNLLKIFHYILAGLTGFGALVVAAVFFGAATLAPLAELGPNDPPPAVLSLIVGGVGAGITLLLVVSTTLWYLTGKFLSERKHHTFCVVVSALHCLSIPVGTILGVFTLVVLARPQVKAVFQGKPVDPPIPGWTV